MKIFYITASWFPNKVIVVTGENRLDAIANASITVWTEAEWKDASKIPGMPKTDEIEWREEK